MEEGGIAPERTSTPSGSLRDHWPAAVLGILFVVLFLPQLVYLVSIVWREEKYSHGFLIPLVSVFYLYSHREEIARAALKPAHLGLLFVLVGLLGWMAAQARTFNALAHLSMMLVLVGMVVFSAGWAFLRRVAFPLFYLVFCFPVPKRMDDIYVVLPLQRLASAVSERIIDVLGIPVLRRGNVIDVPGMKLLVEEACSGIHSLYSLMALGTAFVFMMDRRPWEKIVLMAATVPIAVVANVFRVTLTGILAYWVSPETAKGFFHEFSGLMVFLLGLGIFLLLATLLRRWFPVREPVEDAA